MNRLEELKIMLRKSKNTRPSDDLDKSIVRIIEMMIEDEEKKNNDWVSNRVKEMSVANIVTGDNVKEVAKAIRNKFPKKTATEFKPSDFENVPSLSDYVKEHDELEKQVNNQITELKLLTGINKDLHATIAKLKAENKKFEDAFKGLMQFIDREKMSDIFTKFGEMLKNGGLDA